MTCGKTLAGEAFSKEQGLQFIDLDQYIEKQEKMTVLEIFHQKGESYFRTLEVKCLQEIISKNKDIVLSVGGGTPMNPECAKMLKEKTFCIYLQCSPAVLGERLSYLYHNRPTAVELLASATTSAKGSTAEQSEHKKLTKKHREELFTAWAAQQLNTREPLYKACSHAQINTDNFHLPTICSSLHSVLSESSVG